MDKKRAFEKKQLETIIKLYPGIAVDIEGVILNYCGKYEPNIMKVFELNEKIYEDFFVDVGDAEKVDEKKNRLLMAKRLTRILFDEMDEGNIPVNYPAFKTIYMQVKNESLPKQSQTEKFAFKHKIDFIIWHISDIHFGKYNKLGDEPITLSALLGKALLYIPGVQPDLIVISGDLTSEAKDVEFKQFITFCSDLQVRVWGGKRPGRILVVPGNHDVTWEKNRTADKLNKFRTYVENQSEFISVFGSPDDAFENEQILIKRFNLGSSTSPPLALVQFKKHNLDIFLFVSCYFSGSIPKDVIKCLGARATSDNLINILRQDIGCINDDYLYQIEAILSKICHSRSIKLGLIHHNQVQFGREPCLNPNAPLLLKALAKYNINILLNGHVHLSDQNLNKEPQPREAFSIPASTLSSITIHGINGFNVLGYGDESGAGMLSCCFWNISNSGDFDEKGIKLLRTVKIQNGNVSVVHNDE